MSGSISRMFDGRALRFLGNPTRPGGREIVSPCSSTLLARPMVASSPVLANPNPVLAMFFTPSCGYTAVCHMSTQTKLYPVVMLLGIS